MRPLKKQQNQRQTVIETLQLPGQTGIFTRRGRLMSFQRMAELRNSIEQNADSQRRTL
jgi:hypothetical protein